MALERVDRLTQEFELEVEWHAFELHPEVPPEGMDLPWRPEQVAAARAHFERMAKAAGLPVGPRTRLANSRLALEAAEWAKAQGPAAHDCLHRGLFRAYFVDGLNLGDVDVLAQVATRCGLPADDLRRALAEGRFRQVVDELLAEARDTGVTAVPAFVAGGYAVVGAQPLSVLRQLVQAAGAQTRDNL